MTETDAKSNENVPIALMPTYRDRAVPTYFVDGFSGVASINGVERITFVESVFNPAEGATAPTVQPVVTVAIPRNVLLSLLQMMVAPEPDVDGPA